MNTPPFNSIDALRQQFIHGLERLADDEKLGGYILACANAAFDPQLWQALKPKLADRFEFWAATLRQQLRSGRMLAMAEDDVTVFLKLLAAGFDTLTPTQFRYEDEWEVQFNLLRSFRPPRMAQSRVSQIKNPFDPHAFHFNKPFLRREALWSGEIHGIETELLYNKFPFVSHHALWVPERDEEWPQFIHHHHHDSLWQLTAELGRSLPGIGFGYNAYGAFCSVNHLHFQLFVRDTPLPITQPEWRHNGGDKLWPVLVSCYDDPLQAWHAIHHYHQQNQPYNLIYLPHRLYLIPRRLQGSYTHAAWSGGFSWYEMAGGMMTFNHDDYRQLDSTTIRLEMQKVGLSAAP
jgi:ATP adenylyltransferase/5',5'''-P-1,P-4-tetraphosphate phosphorylase II